MMIKYVHYDTTDGHAIAFYDTEPTFLDHYVGVDVDEESECYGVDLSTVPPTPLYRPVAEFVPDSEPLGPSQLDIIEAQVMYTAMMTDTLIEEV